MVWAVFAVMTGAVVLAVLWPLGRTRKADVRAPDVDFYRTQVAGIERDLGLGLLTPHDAEAAKTEAARRLLSVSADDVRQPSRTAVRAAAAVSLVLIPAVTLALYGRLGSPDMADRPLASRAAERSGQAEIADAIGRIEAHLAANPADGRGWEVLAPVYMKLGRYDEAAKAYGESTRLNGETPDRLVLQGEAMVYAAREQVTAPARAVFERALALRPGDPVATYYVALSREQAGEKAEALALYGDLAATSPADAPWLPSVRARIVALGGEPPSAQQPDQGAMVRGMVESLAARLEQDGRDVDGWLRLLRSYAVLREPDRVKAALAKARAALAGDEEALRRVDALAQELGMT